MTLVRERALNVDCPRCNARRDEPCRNEAGVRQWAHLTRVDASRDVAIRPLPDPMPARLPDGTPVWLHYEPVRWERHP